MPDADGVLAHEGFQCLVVVDDVVVVVDVVVLLVVVELCELDAALLFLLLLPVSRKTRPITTPMTTTTMTPLRTCLRCL